LAQVARQSSEGSETALRLSFFFLSIFLSEMALTCQPWKGNKKIHFSLSIMVLAMLVMASCRVGGIFFEPRTRDMDGTSFLKTGADAGIKLPNPNPQIKKIEQIEIEITNIEEGLQLLQKEELQLQQRKQQIQQDIQELRNKLKKQIQEIEIKDPISKETEDEIAIDAEKIGEEDVKLAKIDVELERIKENEAQDEAALQRLQKQKSPKIPAWKWWWGVGPEKIPAKQIKQIQIPQIPTPKQIQIGLQIAAIEGQLDLLEREEIQLKQRIQRLQELANQLQELKKELDS